MNKIATFQDTVGILVKAYLGNTLQKGNCCACAVGNICASALGVNVIELEMDEEAISVGADRNLDWSHEQPRWQSFFATVGGEQKRWEGFLAWRGLRQVEATGYSVDQLARIEFAFETGAKGLGEAAEFAGLMAVVDVLADIHGIDLATTEAAKLLFAKC